VQPIVSLYIANLQANWGCGITLIILISGEMENKPLIAGRELAKVMRPRSYVYPSVRALLRRYSRGNRNSAKSAR
jgi:hypothetical protein